MTPDGRTRPAEHLVHTGPSVTLDGLLCAKLNKLLGLDKIRAQLRGKDRHLDEGLLAIRLTAAAYESSSAGTYSAPQPVPVSRSTQQLNDTVSTSTAADILGLTDRAIRKAITENRLKATQLDKRWRIHRDDLAQYQADKDT